MSGVNYLTVQELNQLRDRIIQRSLDLRQIPNPRLSGPLQSIENRLANDIAIPPRIPPSESSVIQRKLNDCNSLLDDLEYWHNCSDGPSSSLRELIGTFASLVSVNHDVFVLESTQVTINSIPGLGFSIIGLDQRFIKNPRHWCLCAHEVGAHILKDEQRQPIFAPNLPLQMQNADYRIAVQIWDGLYPPRRDGWFSELYGDLWSCRRLGSGYPLSFNDYVISFFDRRPNVGRRKHPPSNLRLTLMNRYLDGQGYPANTLPNHIPLQTLLPTLTVDDSESLPPNLRSTPLPAGWIVYDLSGLLEVYDEILIDKVERLAHSDLNTIPSNTNDILASYRAISSGSIVGSNLVADVSGLAMFHNTHDEPPDHIIEQLMNTYL